MSKHRRESILITGARGFIGRALITQLQHCGKQLLRLDHVAVRNSAATNSCVCDVSRVEDLRHIFESQHISGIVHLAAVLPTTASKDPLRATQVNVTGSLNLLDMAREFGVRRFVFGSSLSIYGTCAADEVVSENHRTAPEDLYGSAKLYVEQLGKTYSDSYGIEFVSLRIGRVVGPGAHSVTSAWRSGIFECLRGCHPAKIEIPYAGTERVLLVHVDDVARALSALLQSPRLSHTIYNAPCESVLVADLKRQVELLNPNVDVRLGTVPAAGNPRMVNCSRFQREFGVKVLPIFEQLRSSVEDRSASPSRDSRRRLSPHD